MVPIPAGQILLGRKPGPTWLTKEEGWWQLLTHSTVKTVVFDQCRISWRMEGALVKKPTLVISNASELLEPFQNLRCTGNHAHTNTWGQGGALSLAQVWTWQFAERIVDGIVKLKHRLRSKTAYPAVGADAGPPPEAPDPEAWEKCPGCKSCKGNTRENTHES